MREREERQLARTLAGSEPAEQETNQDRGEERRGEREGGRERTVGIWRLASMGGMSSIQYSHYPTIIQYSSTAFAFKLKQTFLTEKTRNLHSGYLEI